MWIVFFWASLVLTQVGINLRCCCSEDFFLALWLCSYFYYEMILSHFQVDWRYDWRPSEKVLGFDLSWWNQSPCPAVSDDTSIKSAAKGFPVPFWSLFELKGMKKHVWEAEGTSESPACSRSWLLALPPREILRFTALMFKHENGSPVAAEGTEMLPPCLDGEVGTRGPLRGQREPQKCLQSRWDSQGTILLLALEEIWLSSVTIKTPKDFCARALTWYCQMMVAFSAIGSECSPVHCSLSFVKQKPGQLVGEGWQPAGKSAKLKAVLRTYLDKLLSLCSLTHNKNA